MKSLYFFLSCFLVPFILPAQAIHGIWSGTLVNDSTHTTQNFELGLSEYRGKITGYTYTTFIDNDTFYYSIKRVRAERKGGKLVIEDVEMVGNNFPERASKKVKQTTTFPLINDSTFEISAGRWNTNQTKKYYSIGGKASIREQEDEKQSDLLSHLQELDVKTPITVRQKERTENKVVATNTATVKPKQENNDKIPDKKQEDVVKNPPVTKETKLSTDTATIKLPGKTVAKTNEVPAKPVQNNDSGKPVNSDSSQVQPVASNKNNNSINNSVSKTEPIVQKKPDEPPVAQKKNQPSTVVDTIEQKKSSALPVSSVSVENKDKPAKELPAAVTNRKTETMQQIDFRSDSLVLSLYDNGIVDGDTVSVFVNGENIISKQKLREAATKKTIYISPNTDSLQLVLFAENLGTIPPNTGLMTIRDGDDVYQVRFSADLQKNASIILRRRKEK